jgi:CBS domain-containing protein/mannitol/fructose-specific phosphotransferase system IIA component (Ntr-type)
MDLLDLLRSEHVVAPLEARGVRAAIEELLGRLERSGAIGPAESLRQRIRHEPLREVVSISDHVVLPHYRSNVVSSLVLALGVAPEPLESDDPGVDVRPRIVALVLAPPDAATLYLQATSTLARLLRQPDVVEEMVREPDPERIVAIKALQGLRLQHSLAVRDVMAHRVRSVPPDTSLRGAMKLMLRGRLRAVPVVGSKGEVLGMVTDADLMRALLPQIPRSASDDAVPDPGLMEQPVREIMTRSVLCVSEELGIREVANMMINKGVEQVPVVKAGAITGVVSRRDIIRKLFSKQ